MFPIHSFSGRVIAFGGRTLKSDKNVPKYVNSPESEIYHKSSVLYGLYFAKKAIREEDNCYLVEGYADVISVHQAGIENVVASSGTSLTVEQIRLMGRLTKNITILYDGDAAGIKASLRGLDLILEEGLNVKVVLFPDGHDPDSYVRKVGTSAFKKYIEDTKKDFILYKTDLLLKDAGNDPIKKAEVIREIVESVAKIPDSIKASVFIQECSYILQIDERALLSELNKIRAAKARKDSQQSSSYSRPEQPPEDINWDEPTEKQGGKDDDSQEKEIIRLLLMYGNRMIDWDGIANTYIGPFMIAELSDVEFDHRVSKTFVELYRKEVENGVLPDEQHFIHYPDKEIVDLTVTLIATKYTLSENWYEMHRILVNDEQVNMKATILGAIFHLKKQKVGKILENLRKELQTTTAEADQEILLSQYMHMKKVEKTISDYLGSVILK
jgi:DNA primase